MKKYVCTICGYIYDEAAGIPSAGIAPGTAWEQLPEGWVCPLCGAAKSEFQQKDASAEPAEPAAPAAPAAQAEQPLHDMRELSVGEVSALCSNLAKGCEKQYLREESALFTQLADYFKSKTPEEASASTQTLLALVQKDLDAGFALANAAAGVQPDRGALRALVWSEKVTRILNALLTRYEKEGGAFLAKTNVYVCETCGFVYVGDEPPALCPVCKVPSWKLLKIERREQQ
ncbi:MAG: rubredoxin [Ruthenibacterium sp.]